eukprot:83484_1
MSAVKSNPGLHNRQNTRERKGNRAFSVRHDENDASQMVVNMLEAKLKKLQNILKLEHTKKKKAENTARSLVKHNEEYKTQIRDLQQSLNTMKTEKQTMKSQYNKLQNQTNEYKSTIQELKRKNKTVEIEHNESVSLINKLKEKQNIKMEKQKREDTNRMNKYKNELLQSLDGENTGKDVKTLINDIKSRNNELQNEFNQLTLLLEKQNESLLNALTAVENLNDNKELEKNNDNCSIQIYHEKKDKKQKRFMQKFKNKLKNKRKNKNK